MTGSAVATFVLVHGAWHGGWCWRKVVPLLRAGGHAVHTPTLTGLGERAHLATREVGLDTHVQDLLNVLLFEDLREVVLVGHSYGGLVIAGTAEQAPERLAHLVYLDALVADDGQSCLDLLGPAARAPLEEVVRSGGEGWRLPIDVEPTLDSYGVVDPAERRWMAERLVPHPWKTLTDRLRLPIGHGGALPRTFVDCPRGRAGPSGGAERARSEPGWRSRQIDTGHDAMVTAPRELVELLLEAGA
jgi:pimeloyl-ACP methyl ester carboxylesterase